MPLPSYYNVKPAGSGNPPATGGMGFGKNGGSQRFSANATEYKAPYGDMYMSLSPIDGAVLKKGPYAKGTYAPVKGNH